MDLRTGRIYESKEAALAPGVPESDVMEITRDLEFWTKQSRTKYQTPHQNTRECERRMRQLRKADKVSYL